MINRVVLVGRLTKDPELRKTPNNVSVTTFTLAVDDRPSGARETSTSFFTIVAWNNTADFVAQYIKKGHLVGVDGRLQQRSYENNSGQKVYVIEVIADSVQSYQPKDKDEETPVAAPQAPVENVVEDDDDLPF